MKKLSISMFVVFITLFGIFAVATPAMAMTCNSATIESTTSTYSQPVSAYFTYGTDQGTVASGSGTSTPTQTINPGSFIQQLITGLTQSTTYYYKLIVPGQSQATSVNNFTTPACSTPPPVQTCQDTTASNYGGALPCNYPVQVCRDTTATNYGGALPCNYPQVCRDTTATNYGGTLPCRYQVQNPTVSLYASPSNIQAGASSTLSWSSTNANSCSAYWTNGTSTNGSSVVVPANTTTYSITCYGNNGQQANASTTVYVTPVVVQIQNPTVTLVANPTSVNYDGLSTLTWNSTNATSCYNSWNGDQSISGSVATGALTNTTNYTINCSNNSGSASASATVYVQANATCQDTTATNYGGTLPCTYPVQVCRDTTATNYGGTLPCIYQQNYYQPIYQQPVYQQPIVYQQPVYQQPVYQQPVYQQPVYQQPVYQQPVVNNSLNVVTTQATQVLDTSAQLNSLISSSATSPINAWFEWGPTINLGNTTTTTAVGTLPSVIHTDTLSGLDAGTTYYYQAFAQDSYQSVHGSILSFTTSGTQNPATIVKYINRTASNALLLITSSVNRDQAIVPTIDNTRPHPGDEINYTVNYQNVGTSSATNLSLQLVLPQEVTYISSNPSNPNVLGNTLVFNLGTLRGGASGVVTVKTQVNSDATAGTLLNFPATLNYVDASGQQQSVNANITAQIWSADTGTTSPLGAFAFGAGFFPGNIFGWLLLIILLLLLVWLAKYLYGQRKVQPAYIPVPPTPPYVSKKTTTVVVDHQQPLGKKTTTTTVEQ